MKIKDFIKDFNVKIMDDWLEKEMKDKYTTEEADDAGTIALKQCLKYVENMTTEEYNKLYNKALVTKGPNPDGFKSLYDFISPEDHNKIMEELIKDERDYSNTKLKSNERDMLKDAYNYLEKFLESNEADNQYFNQLDILYKIAKNGLKTIDKI